MSQETDTKKPKGLRFPEDEAFRCLRAGQVEEFNNHIADFDMVDLSNCDLKGTDFRGVDLRKVILRDSYLRDADLRGADLRHMNLEGCSIYHAKISGAYFPDNLSVEEIRMSLEYGTRLRTNRDS